MVDLDSTHPQYLLIARFKRKMEVSDADWKASQPQISIELRKGRREVLKRVLEAEPRPFSRTRGYFTPVHERGIEWDNDGITQMSLRRQELTAFTSPARHRAA